LEYRGFHAIPFTRRLEKFPRFRTVVSFSTVIRCRMLTVRMMYARHQMRDALACGTRETGSEDRLGRPAQKPTRKPTPETSRPGAVRAAAWSSLPGRVEFSGQRAPLAQLV